MNRRGFLKALGTAIAGVAVSQVIPDDPERRIWVPGEKTHFLPPAGGWVAPNGAEYWYRPYRTEQLAFHKDAFNLAWDDRWPGTKDAIDQAAKDLAAAIDRQVMELYSIQNPKILVTPDGVQTIHSPEFQSQVAKLRDLKEQVLREGRLTRTNDHSLDASRYVRAPHSGLEIQYLREFGSPQHCVDILYGFNMVQNPPYGVRILEDPEMPKDEIRVAAGSHVVIIKGITE